MEAAVIAAKEMFKLVKVNLKRCELLLERLLERSALDLAYKISHQEHSDRLTVLKNVSDM